MKTYFPDDTYTTPVDTPGFLLDYLLFKSRWALYLKFVKVVFSARKKALAGNYDDEEWAESSYRTMSLIEGCGGRLEVEGLDNVRNLKSPVVFIGNHMSTLETLVLPVLIAPFVKVTYVVKEKLVRGPAFGAIMQSRDPITVGRTDPRADLQSVLSSGKKLLDRGYSVIIFPQSTRREIFKKDHFNSLGIKLALHAGVDVVPFALKTDFWTNGKLIKGFGRLRRDRPVHIAFGSVMKVDGRGKKEHQQIVDFVTAHLKSWGALIEE